jgi:methylglutaconyl-CoA hydratase
VAAQAADGGRQWLARQGGVTVDDPLVRLEVADGVAQVVLDSPHNRNALSRRLLADLASAIDAATADPAARVIVLTGAGTVFCSGADLKEQRAANEAGAGAQPINELPAILLKLWTCEQPVVCRLNGPARAGGVGLLASCDLVVASQEVSFSFTEVRLGLVPAIITVPVLRRVAPQAVHRLFLTAELFSAEEARDIGLIDYVAGIGELDDEVARVVDMLMRGGPEALALTKQLVPKIRALPTEEAFTYLAQLSAERFASAEGLEGMQSFAQKRDPSWVRQQ